MAITKNTRDLVTYSLFAGRVLKVEQTTETRNWSDTMDYSDYRTTQCTYALVWLGTHGLPPSKDTTRPMAHYGSVRAPSDHMPDYLAAEGRDLEFWEQFAWVDCTNIFADRYGYSLQARTDAAPFISGDPVMWANFIAWEAYMDSASRERAAAAAAALEAVRKEKEARETAAAARTAKREAKAAASKVTADAELAAALPLKGTEVTVGGFTGTVFWMGVRQYRGTWNANAGIKDARGEVKWVPCRELRG